MTELKEIMRETGNKYPVSAACGVLGAPRSSYYFSSCCENKQKRGPKTTISDVELLSLIREVINDSSFNGEGVKKITFRLKYGKWNTPVGKERVRRIMRNNNLLAPVRFLHKHGKKAHDKKIITQKPNEIWAADATKFHTDEDGLCWFFGTVDHFNSECIGFNIAKIGDRWAAIESTRNAVRNVFGTFEKDSAKGVSLRHDWGTQYTSRDFQADIKFAGLSSFPAFVNEPETNGVVERFFRTLKEHCIYLHRFKNIEEAKQMITEFIEKYNNEWIVGRLAYKTPVQARKDYYSKTSESDKNVA
jgi:putative transposase